MASYELYFYRTASGREEIVNFIEKLGDKTKARIRNAFNLLKEYGLNLLGTAFVKKVNKEPALFELRVVGDKQIRFLFMQYNKRSFIILSGFVKKSQKIPRKEIDKAIKRAREFL